MDETVKHFLVVTFDLVRDSEPETSLAAGCLMSYLKADKRYGHIFVAEHLSFNLLRSRNLTANQVIEEIGRKHDWSDLDAIAIGCYVWADRLTRDVIQHLRKSGFIGRLILGGYQISNDNNLTYKTYPEADVFVLGYGEAALMDAFLAEKVISPRFVTSELDLNSVPSPYLTNEIKVMDKQKRVRIETKRGCPNNCSFCGHQDLHRHQVYVRPLNMVFDEFSYMKTKEVKKINVVDPFFNCGDNYNDVLDHCYRIGLESLITLQVRFDRIKEAEGTRFLERCSSLDISLEFGLQSVIPAEIAVLHRADDIDHAKNVMKTLKQVGIPFSVSLMYGIPFQTVDTLRQSVELLLANGCQHIYVFPLMLLPGTQLWATKDKWQLREEPFGRLSIPVVTSANTFDNVDWNAMRGIAGSLRRKYRQNNENRVD